jgi:hypothetical protein
MKRSIFIIAVLVWITGFAFTQTKRPAFTSYSAAVEKPLVHAINFKASPDARSFRTRLSDAIKGGVNFAGHFVVAGWGCGTGCISGAIVDARTGRVYWPIQFNAMSTWYDGNEYVDKPVEYRKNSRLLVLRGSPGVKDGDADKPYGEYYYELRNNELRLIKFIPYKRTEQ